MLHFYILLDHLSLRRNVIFYDPSRTACVIRSNNLLCNCLSDCKHITLNVHWVTLINVVQDKLYTSLDDAALEKGEMTRLKK